MKTYQILNLYKIHKKKKLRKKMKFGLQINNSLFFLKINGLQNWPNWTSLWKPKKP